MNLTQPDQSRMVMKVAGGHNCWLQSPAACGDTLTVWIRNWAGASATGGTQIQLQAPDHQGSGRQQELPGDSVGGPSAAFAALYALVRNAARRTACAATPRARPRSSSRSSRMPDAATSPTRPSSRRSISTTPTSRASSCACATSSTTAGATRVARPTRRPCSTPINAFADRDPGHRTSIRRCSSPRA